MPGKTRAKNVAIAAKTAVLPTIPKELVDQFVRGPMTAEAIQDASMAFKKALIECGPIDTCGLSTSHSVSAQRLACLLISQKMISPGQDEGDAPRSLDRVVQVFHRRGVGDLGKAPGVGLKGDEGPERVGDLLQATNTNPQLVLRLFEFGHQPAERHP